MKEKSSLFLEVIGGIILGLLSGAISFLLGLIIIVRVDFFGVLSNILPYWINSLLIYFIPFIVFLVIMILITKKGYKIMPFIFLISFWVGVVLAFQLFSLSLRADNYY